MTSTDKAVALVGERAICTYVDALTGTEWGRYDAGLFGWPDGRALRQRLRETCQFWSDDVFLDLSSLPVSQTVHVIQIVSDQPRTTQTGLFDLEAA